MKTAKEKAKELFEKFSKVDGYDFNIIQCALIAVDEVKNAVSHKDDFKYWQKVKLEIEKL